MNQLTDNRLISIFRNERAEESLRILAAMELSSRLPEKSKAPYLQGCMRMLSERKI